MTEPADHGTPPPVLNCARVLEFAVLDAGVRYSGSSGLFVDGLELGPVPCLALCQGMGDTDFLLFHCSALWEVLGIARYDSADQAKRRAERVYPGVTSLWVETGVSEDDAVSFLDELFRDQKCSFCGKRPDQVDRILQQNGVRICDACVREFQRDLDADRNGCVE